MKRERDRVERARHRCRAGAHGLDRRRERDSTGALAVEADWQAARLPQPLDERAGLRGVERARRVVDQHSGRAELRQALRALEQHLDLAARPGAVHEPDRQLFAGFADRAGRFAQVPQVVERVMDAEDVDAAGSRAGDEAAHDVAGHGTRADEEAAPQRHPERRGAARPERADALPRALDPEPDGAVEAASARDLETREPGVVELPDELVEPGRRDPLGQRLLGEEPDRRVDERRHASAPSGNAARRVLPGGALYAREM
jgi:hypothetical protein